MLRHILTGPVLLVALAAPAVAQKDKPEPKAKSTLVAIKTNHGTIKVELYPKKAPITVKNFLDYVEKKHYDGTVFHRVIEGFMIQGGGFKKGTAAADSTADFVALQKKSGKPIKNEAKNGLSNTRGTIAMARTSEPDTATAQFFINTVDNSGKLDPGKFSPDGYAVFGKVVEGMDVVDKIRKVKTKKVGAFGDVPAEDVVIESVRKVAR